MTILILRTITLFLAIALTGVSVTSVALLCCIMTKIDSPDTDILGRSKVKVSMQGTWIWFLVGFLWAAFFFLGKI